MSEIVNQLKNQNYSTVSPVSFKQVGGQIFPDNPALFDVLTLTQIVDGYRATNAPTYGQPIPNTFVIQTTAGEPGYFPITLNTSANKTYRIEAISVTNTGGSPLTATVELGDGANFAFVDTSGSLGAGAVYSFKAHFSQHFDNNIKLYGFVSSGTEADAVYNVVYCEIIQ